MAESLNAHQIEQVLELGAWRDEGRLFAVGLNGKVSKYEDDEEYQDGPKQWQGAAASAPSSASAPPAASGAAADSEPDRADRSEALAERYLGFRPEILRYYPTARFKKADDGLWITARICPLGPDSPGYWTCLILPDDPRFSAKAFAFHRLSPIPRPVGPRHTNFPDRSICAFTDEDDAWRPGDNPKILLNLYAEWLVCQLFLKLKSYWPGRQVGLDATYRLLEFADQDWCDCGSEKRYGACHRVLDQLEVGRLKAAGKYVPLPPRIVPSAIIRFAKSKWKKLPGRLQLHPYEGQPPRP